MPQIYRKEPAPRPCCGWSPEARLRGWSWAAAEQLQSEDDPVFKPLPGKTGLTNATMTSVMKRRPMTFKGQICFHVDSD